MFDDKPPDYDLIQSEKVNVEDILTRLKTMSDNSNTRTHKKSIKILKELLTPSMKDIENAANHGKTEYMFLYYYNNNITLRNAPDLNCYEYNNELKIYGNTDYYTNYRYINIKLPLNYLKNYMIEHAKILGFDPIVESNKVYIKW